VAVKQKLTKLLVWTLDMSIAQHSVAGEGEAHPQVSSSSDVSSSPGTDSAALTAFQCDAANLPWVIFRAAFRAAHIEDIPQRARALLSALARTVEAARPYAAIFAGRALLTDRALHSKRTLYRALADLEAAGLIRRPGQLRILTEGYEGRFGRAYLHFTETAAVLLGLVESPDERSNVADSAQEQAAQSFEEPSAKVAHGAYIRDLSPTAFQKRQSGQPPEDLQRLRGLGFSDFLIFKLMKQAGELGKRLSDVVEITWENLKKADRPICYLNALLRNPIDFGHQLKQKNKAQAEVVEKRAQVQEAETLAQDLAGEAFTDAKGRVYQIAAGGDEMSVYDPAEGVTRWMPNWKAGFLQALKDGKVQKKKDPEALLVLASA
jgi:hypothetical protein